MGRKRGASKGKAQQQNRRFYSGTVEFARGVRGELRRVSWPNRDQLQQSTAVVLIILVVLALYVAGLDWVFQNLAKLIFA
jgi:preprotein translocase subunit SecE